MKTDKKLELRGGQIIRKCPIEHFTPQQFMYGSPYSYIIEYADYAGGSPERRYGLWRFDDKTLTYSLFQTAGENDYSILSDIASSWEWEMREQRHIDYIKTMPRSFWSDDDKVKYAHIEAAEEIQY
jgi:hypothetical protein